MFRKILKWIGITFGSVILLAGVFYAYVHLNTESRIKKKYAVSQPQLAIPTDSASYALGRHVAETRGCIGCHGANLAQGRAFADEASPIGILYASNLTNGKGGINYTDADWLRSLRHGLDKNNQSLWFMPSHEVCHLSNQELAALVGFLKKQAPVDKLIPGKSLKPLGRILTFLGEFPLLTAEKIDHTATYPDQVKIAANVESGKYLATTCTGCHGVGFKGGPAHTPGQPAIPDISATGNVGKWQPEGFMAVFRTGKTPDGRVLSEYMPVKEFNYSDEELKAIYLYLHGMQ